MKKIIFTIHGIRSKIKGNWIYDFIKFGKKDSRFTDDVFIPYYYGFISSIACIIPFVKYYMVNKVKRKIRKVVADNPNCELNIVAHSYGSELCFWAIKTSGEDGKSPIKVNKFIVVASVISRHYHIPYTDTLRAGKIKALHCYASYKDKVTALAPFGHSGTYGFARDKYDSKCYPKPFTDLEIYNYQTKTLRHGDYFKSKKYYKEWLEIINENT